MMKRKKKLCKKPYSVDVDARLILSFASQRGPRFDTRFAISAIRNIKKYNPKSSGHRVYDTGPIKKCINEEAKAID